MGVIRKRRPFFPLLLGMAIVIGILPVISIRAEDKPPDFVVEEVETEGEDKEEVQIPKGEEPIIKEETTEEVEKAEPETGAEQPELSEHQHDVSCGFVEAQPEIACDHQCKEMDQDEKLMHCKECTYRPEVMESPCKWEIKEEEKKEDKDAEKSIAEETPEPNMQLDMEDTSGPEGNEAAFLVRIPSHVFLSEASTSFDVETEKVGQLQEGNVVITVEGTTSEETGNFALYREGDPEICYEYQLQMGEQTLTGRQNKMIIDRNVSGQSMTVIPMNQSWELPAGSYQGTLTFRVSYEPEE